MRRGREDVGRRAAVGAGAARRGGGESGSAEAVNAELNARLSAVVDGLTRFTQELREVTQASHLTAPAPVGRTPRAETEERAVVAAALRLEADSESEDDAEVTAVAAAVAAASARRKAAMEAYDRGSTACAACAGAGDAGAGGVGGAGGSGARSSLGSATSRTSSSYVFRVTPGSPAASSDWLERIPVAPPPGRAPSYPRKPERAPFELPSPVNQRDAPRSLVEWYMTRVYDPVQVTERAQVLLARRKMERESTTTVAPPPPPEPSPPPSLPSSPQQHWHPAREGLESAPNMYPIEAGSADAEAEAKEEVAMDMAETWTFGAPEVCVPLQMRAYDPAIAEVGVTETRTVVGTGPSRARPQTALQRNRAHVLGSSLQLGDAPPRAAPRELAEEYAAVHERVEGAAAGAMAGVVQGVGAASDAVALERRRIRRKVMGGGRPDWLVFDAPTELPLSPPFSDTPPPTPPPTPPQPPLPQQQQQPTHCPYTPTTQTCPVGSYVFEQTPCTYHDHDTKGPSYEATKFVTPPQTTGSWIANNEAERPLAVEPQQPLRLYDAYEATTLPVRRPPPPTTPRCVRVHADDSGDTGARSDGRSDITLTPPHTPCDTKPEAQRKTKKKRKERQSARERRVETKEATRVTISAPVTAAPGPSRTIAPAPTSRDRLRRAASAAAVMRSRTATGAEHSDGGTARRMAQRVRGLCMASVSGDARDTGDLLDVRDARDADVARCMAQRVRDICRVTVTSFFDDKEEDAAVAAEVPDAGDAGDARPVSMRRPHTAVKTSQSAAPVSPMHKSKAGAGSDPRRLMREATFCVSRRTPSAPAKRPA